MSPAEYLEATVSGMHALVTELERRFAAAEEPGEWTLNALGAEMSIRWRELLAGLEPPPEMAELHGKLTSMAFDDALELFAGAADGEEEA